LKTGFKIGLIVGVAQDILSVAQGRRLAYVEILKQAFGLEQAFATDTLKR
jgi:hypothetical protein